MEGEGSASASESAVGRVAPGSVWVGDRLIYHSESISTVALGDVVEAMRLRGELQAQRLSPASSSTASNRLTLQSAANEAFKLPVDEILINEEIKQASNYWVFKGTFGALPGVVVKRSDVANKAAVKNDKERMQSAHLSGLFQHIMHCAMAADHVYTVCVSYETNVYEILDSPDCEKLMEKYDIQLLYRGALQGLEWLQARRLVHGDMRSKNIAVILKSETEWQTVLCGLRYCKRKESCAVGDVWSSKREFYMDEGKAYDYESDKYSLACVMYMVSCGKYEPSPSKPLEPGWGREPYTEWRRAQLKHLLKMVFKEYSDGRSRSLPNRSYLCHPFFMNEQELVNWRDRVWGVVSVGGMRVNKHINAEQGILFQSETWTERLDAIPNLRDMMEAWRDVRNVFSKYKPEMEREAVSLIALECNRVKHRTEDTARVRVELRVIPAESLRYWHGLFPYLFIYFWHRMIQYEPRGSKGHYEERRLHNDPEFAPYFPAGRAFYDSAIDVPLLERSVMVEIMPNLRTVREIEEATRLDILRVKRESARADAAKIIAEYEEKRRKRAEMRARLARAAADAFKKERSDASGGEWEWEHFDVDSTESAECGGDDGEDED